MCSRYTLTTDAATLSVRFKLAAPPGHKPRYNIAPSQDAPVVLSEGGARGFASLRWGLVPSWAKEKAHRAPIINARAESLANKPSFQGPLAGRRCLVPADGFYEWRGASSKPPLRFTLEEGLFSFAGLWDSWKAEDGAELRTFTIITVPANPLLSPVHDRMPAILPREWEERWLAPTGTPATLLALLKPYPAERMRTAEASLLVNSPAWDAADCLVPDDPEPELF